MDHTKPWLRYVATSSLNDETLDLDEMKVRNDQGEELGTVDGFVVDSGSGRPRYVVVDAGGWFTAKQFLVPIGEVHLEPPRDALRVSLAKEQIRRFPGFDLDQFQPLSADDIDRLNTQRDTSSHPADTTRGFVWTDDSFQVPEWWGQKDGEPGRNSPEVQSRLD
jgi:hypothetical protein